MTIEVNLQVKPLDFDDPQVQDTLDALNDYGWAVVNGITLMTVFSDGDPVSDCVQALRCARARNIEVVRVFDEQVNHGEIARRVGGFSREAVRKWSQNPSFPLAVGSGGGDRPSPQYRWAEVLQWLEEVKGIEMDEHLPDEKTITAINAHIHHVFHDEPGLTNYPVAVDAEPRLADVISLPTVKQTVTWTVTLGPTRAAANA